MAAIDEALINLLNLVVGQILCFLLSLLGTVTNSINIAVFLKQGFTDGTTISFFSISALDLVRCLLDVPFRLDWLVSLVSPPWVIESFGKVSFWQFLAFANPLSAMVSVMTAYVNLERCLAVCIPFKVKWVITTKVTGLVLTASSILVACSQFAFLCAVRPVLVFSPKYNKTIFDLEPIFCNLDEQSYFRVRCAVTYFWSVSTFLIVAICTLIIIIRTRAASRRRSQFHGNNRPGAPIRSTREKQMIKALLLINLVHLIGNVCQLFQPLIYTLFGTVNENEAIASMVTAIFGLFTSFNASVNFFIYFKVSSNFKATLKTLAHRSQNP